MKNTGGSEGLVALWSNKQISRPHPPLKSKKHTPKTSTHTIHPGFCSKSTGSNANARLYSQKYNQVNGWVWDENCRRKVKVLKALENGIRKNS